MYQVKEHEIKNEFIMKKSNLKRVESYLRIRQLHFLTHIAHMDPSCLPRQVVNSQANANGSCSRNVATTKRGYKMALEKVGLCQNDKGEIMTQAWIERLKHPDTAELIETNLGLTHGSFKRKKRKKKKRGKHLISCSLKLV